MLQLIYGKTGSGKSTVLLKQMKERADRGEVCLLLVPEQQVLSAERAVSELGISALHAEVASFRRLCNSIFRTFGGLCYHYISKGGKKLLIWQALTALAPMLEEYKNVTRDDAGLVRMMLSAVEEMALYRISPEALEDASEALDGRLAGKVRDLAKVTALYHNLLHSAYEDPSEDIDRACALLEKHDYFGGKAVYIDSFAGFTPEEALMLRHIFRQSDEVVLTLGTLPDEEAELFDKLVRTDRLIAKLASETGIGRRAPILLTENKRAEKPALAFLADHLWSGTPVTSEDEPEGIRLIEAADIFAEADAIAARAAELVQSGASYREIAVIVRDTACYRGFLENAFEAYGIPCHLSARVSITSMPQIRLILSALSVAAGNWQTDDVLAYLRTFLAGLSPTECDMIEEYATLWKIRGARWYDEHPWSMHPKGFVADWTDADTQKLDTINELRRKCTLPLVKLFEAFGKDATVRSVSEALYHFLCELSLPEQIAAEAEHCRAEGDNANADRLTQVWNLLMQALDTLVATSGDLSVTPTLYSHFLKLLLEDSDIGTIPAHIDEVTVGSADLLRTSGIHHVILAGVCEGIFPAPPAQGRYFENRERIRLAEAGLTLAETDETLSMNELYYFYNACCAPARSLTVLYTAKEGASMAVAGLRTLFPSLKTERAVDFTAENWAWNRDTAFTYALTHRDEPLSKQILALLSDDPVYKAKIKAAEKGIAVEDCAVDPLLMKEIYPSSLNLTQSRIDRYVSCPFSYYCRYVLGIREPVSGDFEAADIGNFVHNVLEAVFLSLNGRSIATLTDEEIESLAEGCIEDYRRKITRGESTARLDRLFARLTKVCCLLLARMRNEFAQAQFEPVAFELPIGADSPVKPLRIPLPDGSHATVYGFIDRVDAYKKGNDVYIRVVDYKTGKKEFSMADIALGLNLQMLLYLFSVCASGDDAFRRSLGVQAGGSLLPAGVLYFSARTPDLLLASAPEEGEGRTLAEDSVKYNGLLIDDAEVLEAMEAGLNGKYIPVKMKKEGFASTQPLQSLADFGALQNQLCETVASIVDAIRSGQANARPLKDKRHDGCTYCKMRPLCRQSKDN